jgi:hypothetical protein
MRQRATVTMSMRELALSRSAFATEATATLDDSEIRNFEQLGRAMYEQDIRAARSSDLVSQSPVAPPGLTRTGWIVDPEDDGMLVRFVGEVGGAARSYADVRFEGRLDGVVTFHEPAQLNRDELAQYRARQLVSQDLNAMAKLGQLCVSAFNLISLPKSDRSGILVWVIAANTDANQAQIGGHFRYGISDSGEKLLSKDQLYNSCLVLPNNAKSVELFMTWLVSDTPLEIHVFLQLYAHKPFYIGTLGSKTIWKIDDGHISRIGTLP